MYTSMERYKNISNTLSDSSFYLSLGHVVQT